MNVKLPTILLVSVSWVLTVLPVQADLVSENSSRFGANSLTLDTSTGLVWLDLPHTTGLSYNQALADTAPGGIFSGFGFASVQEVLSLYSSAGISGTGYYPPDAPAIQSLFSLIGTTGLINDFPGVVANSGTPSDPGSVYAPAIYQIDGGTTYWVNSGGFQGGGTAYGVTTSFPELGSWLVAVPEPGSGLLIAMGLAIPAFVLRWKMLVSNKTQLAWEHKKVPAQPFLRERHGAEMNNP